MAKPDKKKILNELENLKSPAALNKVMTEDLKKTNEKTEKEKKAIKKEFSNDSDTSAQRGNIELSPVRKKADPIVFNTQEEANKYVGSLAKQHLDYLSEPTNFNNVARGEMQRFGIEKQYEVWEQSPYSGKSYAELTRLRSGIDGDLRRGKITRAEADKEKGVIDLLRTRAANKDELAKMLEEAKENRRLYSDMYSEANREVNNSARVATSEGMENTKKNLAMQYLSSERVKANDGIIAEIEARIADMELDKEYDNTLLEFGGIAIKSGASDEYIESKSDRYILGADAPDTYLQGLPEQTYTFINLYKTGRLNENELKTINGEISNLTFLTDGEVKLYNTLYNNNPEDAENFLKKMEGTLNKRLAEYQSEKALEYGQEHPYLAGLKSVVQNVTTGLPAAVDNVVEGITGKVDTYDATSRILRESQALRQGGSEYFNQKYGEAGGFLYNTGVSIVENLANVFLFKGAGNAASRLIATNMAGNAAANGMINVADKGGSDFQIITSGLANGAAEYLFEKFSVEKLFDIKSARSVGDFVKATLAQSGIEASEEIFTETANILTDAIIMQEKSENSTKLRNYIMQGMSREEASKKVFHESITQIALAGASGFISGGIMGGGATLLNNASRASYITHKGEEMLKNPQLFNKVLEVGIANNNAEANYTAEMISDGLQVDSKQAGKMLSSVIEQGIENNGGMINIMQLIGTIEGRDSSYIGSMESIDTAKAVMHMVQGKATEVDNALLKRSDGAVTLLTAIEGNEKAWSKVKEAAGRELRSEAQQVQSVDSGVRFKISYTTNNEPVTVIEENILDGVSKKNWVETTKNAITKFKPGIKVSGRFIKVNAQTTGEYLHSDYTDSLKKNNKTIYKDKLNAAGHLDEIILSSKNYINEDLKHERTDNIKEFARGDVLLQIGENKYKASVVVGFTKGNEMVLYDIVDINDSNFEIKNADDSERTLNKSSQLRQESSANDRVPQKEKSVNSYSMRDGEVYSQGKKVSIPEVAKTGSNIVLDKKSSSFRKKNPKGYSAIAMMAKDLGMKVKFVKGLTDSAGNQLDGVITSEGIFINTESKHPTKWAATHEFSHRMKQASPEAWQRYQDFVINRLKIDGRYYAVFKAKAKSYGNNNAAYIDEEIAADYIGELFSDETELADFIRESRRDAVTIRDMYYKILDKFGLLEEKKKAQLMWRDAYREAVLNVKDGKVESEGKSEPRFKINPTFERAFDNWVNNLKRKSGITLKVGSTSEALKSINVKDQTIYWSTTKINDTLKKHTDIDINTLKYIPNLIENPVLILRERPQYSKRENRGNNRIYLLGDLYNENGIPVMAFLELEPKDGEIRLDEIYVVSTHSRINEGDESDISYTQGLIDHSQLMYVDPNKNRTNNWLASTKLKMPFHPTTYGPINKITYSDDFVNTYSMQDGGKNSRKSISGARLSDIEAQITPESKYGEFLNEYGGGIQAFRPSMESGWLSQQWIAQRSKGNENAAKSLNQIADIVTKQLGIPVTKKNFKDDNILGNFNPTAEVIHTRAKNDVVTLSHEVGHFLDKKLKMQKFEGIDNLVANFDKTLAALGYTEDAKKSESVSEFVRMYLTNKDVAKTFSAEFYQEFEKELAEKGYKNIIDNLAKEINSYLSSTTSERIALAISEDIDTRTKKEKAKDVVTMKNVRQSLVAKKDKFPELWKNLNRSMIDSFYDIGQAQGRVYAKNPDGKNDAHMLATNSLNSAARSAYILTKAFVNMDGEEVGLSFIDAITPIYDKNFSKRAKNISALNRYLILKHAPEWLEPITDVKNPSNKKRNPKRVFADESLNNPTVIREEIAKIEEELPAVKEAAENIYRYLGNLKKYWGVDVGLITIELSNELDKRYPCYVPFYRENKKKGIKGARISLANQRAPILVATGGEDLIVNPLESIINLTEKYVKTASRNMSMQALAHMADNIEGTGFVIERADGKTQKKLENEDSLYTNEENTAEVTPEELRTINPEEDVWKKEYANGKGYASVLIDGKKVWYQINDEHLFKAVSNMEVKQLNSFLRGCNTVLQVKRALITSNNPLFAATNAVRDAITAYNNIDINNPFSYLRAYFTAFAHVIKKDPNYKRWCAMGGGHSSELSAHMNDVSRALNKALQTSMVNKIMNSILHPIEFIASINDIVESTPRLMAFEDEMKKSGDAHKAINKADDITTNFKRGGSSAKALNNVFMFSNAQIQGLDRTIRSFTKNDTPNGRRNRVIKYAIVATILSVIQQILNRKDEESEEAYKNLSKYMKRSNYVINIGDGNFLRIPTAREQDLLRVIITDCVDYAFGDKEAFDGLKGFVIDALLPPYVELPTNLEEGDDFITETILGSLRSIPIVGTFTSLAANKDFTGTPIIPKSYEDLPPEEQYNEKTSKLAVFLSKIISKNNFTRKYLPTSPFKIDYIINDNLGILGTLSKSLFPMDDKQRDLSIGFKSRWVAASYYSTDVFNKIYEKRDAAELELKRVNNGENLSEYAKINTAATFISQCNKAIKNLPENEKREARKKLQEIMNKWGNGNSQATEELIRLYDTTEEDFFLKMSPISVTTVNGKRNMTFDEYIAYAENYTAAYENVVNQIVMSENYKNMTDDERISVLKRAIDFAEDSSKAEVLPDYELETWQMDIIKANGKLDKMVSSKSADTRLDNIGKELYKDFNGKNFNEEKYNKKVEEYSKDGYDAKKIQSAVNQAGKDTPEYKRNYQTQYFSIEIDPAGLSSKVKERAEKDISSAAEYYAGKETIPGFKGDKFMEVYGEKLSDDMGVGEFLSVNAYAKTEAISWDEDGSDDNLSSKELERYLDSTDYSWTVKGALFEAIGNSNWFNKYTGLKNNGEAPKSKGRSGGGSGSSTKSSGSRSSGGVVGARRSSGGTTRGTTGTRGSSGTRGTSGTKGNR